MGNGKAKEINSPIGIQRIDDIGSPVGVVRMDPEKSYAGIGQLLQDYINNSNQGAWDKIKEKIDYTYRSLDLSLSSLELEANFSKAIKDRLKKGQKLLFKPNIVGVENINPQTHGSDPKRITNTEWAFIAALMRWFHDKLGVKYFQMAVGEAASVMPIMASFYSWLNNGEKPLTVEATLEGKSGNFYGGWGFYFARKYLAETLKNDSDDDPMKGYEESIAGIYIPPGKATDKLMVYDLNRIFDEPTKGREIAVPDGINFQHITLHKAIIGGDPNDPEDMNAYPGCILINVPKFKVHGLTLFTNIIKNLGIGLYPMQFAKTGDQNWDYSYPHNRLPGIKAGIPHEVWVPEIDQETCIPKRDPKGKYIVKKTGGITATMIDIIKAVYSQDIFMLHIVDGIEAINLDHGGQGLGVIEPEGMVFAGLDPVASDLLCARYMFSNVPIKEAFETGIEDGNGGMFPQKVPIPRLEGNNIVSKPGYDCPLSRDICFENAEKRGLGQRQYYTVGWDNITDSTICSIKGHIGTLKNDTFSDLITKTLFYDAYKLPWDMQRTCFNYMKAVDKLENLTLMQDFLEAFDENGDGVVTYEEFGKKGAIGSVVYMLGKRLSMIAQERFGYLKSNFSNVETLKLSDPLMNPDGHDFSKDLMIAGTIMTAFGISQIDVDISDPFQPGLTCGNGKWPSYQFAKFFQVGSSLYGAEYPNRVAFPSLYGTVFSYADLTQNNGNYIGSIQTEPNSDAMDRYISDTSKKQLDFVLYVPEGYDEIAGSKMPNVEVTSDPAKILTAKFNGGKEIWP